MPAATQPPLEPGRVYRTRDLLGHGANAPRLARRLTKEGKLTRLAHGLFAAPKPGRFGAVPPRDEALMTAFLDGSPFVFTGPERWNALGLGSTASFAAQLVYNTRRSGEFAFAGRRFLLRRVAFPERPTAEWYVVDLFEHADEAGASREELAAALRRAVQRNVFDAERLRGMAERFGSKATVALVKSALDP